MDLSIYNIIRGPRVSTKAYQLNQKMQQLVLDVHPQANKIQIMEALKKLFNVEAQAVRIIISKGKRRRVGRHTTIGKTKKKAIITLKKGQSLDLMGWTQPVASEEMTKAGGV
jgi:large subunit ribosomal protein L23